MENIKAVYRYVDDIHREKFGNAQCLLTISVGQEIHEGDKFESTIQLVSNTFQSCIMLVDDTLQRHTMALNTNKTPEELYSFSLDEGSQWLTRNEPYYAQLKNLSKIVRWNTWLHHPAYKINQNLIKNELARNGEYKKQFDLTVKEFLDRYIPRLGESSYFDYDRGYQLCLDYLIEECTAMTLWPELQCHYEVYPSRRNFAMEATHRQFVLAKNPDLLHAVGVKFKNRKQLKPQTFNMQNINHSQLDKIL